MSIDNNIGYEFAGKGAKARTRERLTLQLIPKKLNVRKPRPSVTKPEHERKRAKAIEQSEAFHNAIGIKARVRLLVIDRDVSYLQLMDILKREGQPLSGVTAGNLRSEMKEILRLLESLGLIDRDALARRRKRIKAGDAV